MTAAPLKIRFLNHASFLLSCGDVTVLTDPWLSGSAFNDGWDLIVAREYAWEREFAGRVTHIWYSHEHPDHFAPAFLKSIPAEQRPEVTILYQHTRDKKVLRFCGDLGFAVQELPPARAHALSPELNVTCGGVPFFDSWLLFTTAEKSVLNINDCPLDGPACQRLRNQLDLGERQLDVLFTQFSYAAWKGNVKDKALREDSAARKLAAVREQIQAFGPRWAIPFASFVYFSHEENRYNNDSINSPQAAVQAIADTDAAPVLLFPGDDWIVGKAHNNSDSLERFEDAYEKLGEKEYRRSGGRSLDELKELAVQYVARVKANNNRFLLRLVARLPVVRALRPIRIALTDHDCIMEFSFFGKTAGLKPTTGEKYDVRMHSDSLAFVFRFDWGYDTLTVNGRFEANLAGFDRMTRTFAVGPLNNTGRAISFRLLFDYQFVLTFLRMLTGFVKRLRQHKV